jgi:hypothetical protein
MDRYEVDVETDDDIDWDDIIATTQPDIEARNYAFTTADYATYEEGMAALWDWLCTLGNGDTDETVDPPEPHAPRA